MFLWCFLLSVMVHSKCCTILCYISLQGQAGESGGAWRYKIRRYKLVYDLRGGNPATQSCLFYFPFLPAVPGNARELEFWFDWNGSYPGSRDTYNINVDLFVYSFPKSLIPPASKGAIMLVVYFRQAQLQIWAFLSIHTIPITRVNKD